MPHDDPSKRNYGKTGKDAEGKLHGSSEYKKKRAARNKARRKALREGRVKKGDGKHIHHKDGDPFNDSPGNLVILSASENQRRGHPSKGSKKKKEKEQPTLESLRIMVVGKAFPKSKRTRGD